MRSFFLDKFERDHHQNLSLIQFFEKNEDDSTEFSLKSFSHILNVHYLWNCRLKHQSSESGDWDRLPLSYFSRFQNQNFQETRDIIEHVDWDELVKYHSSEGVPMSVFSMDILFHVLQHSHYHRAQIIRDLKLAGLNPPNFDLIVIRDQSKVTK